MWKIWCHRQGSIQGELVLWIFYGRSNPKNAAAKTIQAVNFQKCSWFTKHTRKILRNIFLLICKTIRVSECPCVRVSDCPCVSVSLYVCVFCVCVLEIIYLYIYVYVLPLNFHYWYILIVSIFLIFHYKCFVEAILKLFYCCYCYICCFLCVCVCFLCVVLLWLHRL